MAQFNADILLSVKRSSQLTNAIKQLEQDIDKIARKAGDIGKFVGKNAEARAAKEALKVRAESLGVVKATTRELERQAKIVNTIANVRSARIARERNEILQQQQRGAGQYATSIGPQPDRTKALRRAEIFDRTAAARAGGIQRQSQFVKLQQAENKAKLEAARATQQLKGDQAAYNRVIKESNILFENAKAVARQATKAEEARQAAIKKTTNVSNTAAKKQERNRAQRALLGGGFPALFGSGPGGILGGAIGESIGDFGGIIGSAIGAQVDNLINGLTELARGLESTTGIIKGLETAGYSVSAATKNVIESYQEAGLVADAYQLAIEEVNRALGPDGASKVSDYRIETENLSKEFQRAKAELDSELLPALTGSIRLILQLSAALEELSRNPIIQFIGKANALVGEALFPGAAGAFRQAQEAGAVSGNVVKPEAQRLAEEEAVLQTLTKQTEELTKQQQKVWEVNDAAREKIGIVEQELIVEQNGADLANQKVYEARKEIIELQTLNKIKEAGLSIDAVGLALAEKKVALAALENARNAALARAAKAASGGAAPQSQAAALQQQIVREELKRLDIRAKALELTKGEEAALKYQNSEITTRLQKETQIVELQRQQALERNKIPGEAAQINQVYDERLKTLTQELQLQYAQNNERLRAIALERELSDIKAKQELGGLRTDLTREIEDAQFRTANPFGGDRAEQMELATAQARRYMDVMKEIEDQEELLKKRIERGALGDELIDTNKKLDKLAEEKKLYEELLPAIAAAEQQELKMMQTLERLQPITDALASGITDFFTSVIDGSKSAQEAFSDMLRGMAQALIQQGAIMIAQYIAIGIARAFAGIGGTPSTGYGTGSQTPLTSGLDFSSAFRADGGPVAAGRSYIVGERGQELFIPGVTGTVVPNDVFEATKEALVDNGEVIPADEADETSAALAANNSSIATTYNNSSNNSTGAESGTAENSSAISTAINTGISTALSQNSQSINSTRFGDTTSTSVSEALAVNNQSIQNQKQNATNTMERETMQQMMDSPSKLTVAYESTVINQQEYVTAEQHQKGVTQAAMKGRDMALASLKNSVRARKGIGLA